MSTETLSRPLILSSFYMRLASMEEIVRIVLSEAELSALLTFRGAPEKKVLLDYRRRPARLEVDGPEKSANIFLTIDADIMHEVMLDRVKPGVALAHREMLLRGSACDLAKFIQLLEFGPMLYDEHAADIGLEGFARYKNNSLLSEEQLMNEKTFEGNPIPVVKVSAGEKAATGIINRLGYAVGYALGVLRYRLLKKLSLFEVLTWMSKGLEAARPERPKE